MSENRIKRFNEQSGLNIPNKISKLIKRKLSGDKLTDGEFLQLHNWMIENDEDYCKSVDIQMRKDMKKYVPKGTIIE